jgi:hypothetical protein
MSFVNMEEYIEKQKARFTSQSTSSETRAALAKAHILPLGRDVDTGSRASACLGLLRPKMGTMITEAMSISGAFVVVKTDPETGGIINQETELFFFNLLHSHQTLSTWQQSAQL